MRGASHQPAFMGRQAISHNCLATSHTCLPCPSSRWVSNELVFVFMPPVFMPLCLCPRRSALLVVWSALIVSMWVVVCGRRSCLGPAEISSFAFLFWFKDGDAGLVEDSIFLIASIEWIFWLQEGGFKILLCGPRDGKVLLRSLDLSRAAKKIVPWKWGEGAV